MSHRRSVKCAFTLIELMIVVGLLAVLISILLPFLSNVRKSAGMAQMNSKAAYGPPGSGIFAADKEIGAANQGAAPVRRPTPLAIVKTFSAKVDLTPKLSVGTAEPESIYEAKFTATLDASAPPAESQNTQNSPCEIHLPLPPQIISLADLSVTVNKEPSDNVTLHEGTLIWTGPLPTTPTPIQVTFSAVGKGLYELQTPPGRILDTFNLEMTANGSDVRMLELSLQPTSLTRAAGQTTYTWNYQRLMFGRPIAVDVLGVAPVDRLGELRWLGPLSVVIFGLIVGLYAHAHLLVKFDRWMLLLILGAFTGAYPLMYFAQEFIPLQWAILGSAALVMLVIAIRAWTMIGLRHAALGVMLPAAATLVLTLIVATHPSLQGLLLTAGGIIVFIVAMILLPKLQWPLPQPKVNVSLHPAT